MATTTESAAGADRTSIAATRQADRSPHLPNWLTATIVGVLLILFAFLSYTAVLGKSATYDEPLHAVGGMVHRFAHDFRINPEDPALFGWWASLPHGSDAIALDTSSKAYSDCLIDVRNQWISVVDSLYSHGGETADRFLNHSRAMFVPLGMALGALIALWAYQLGGGWAAIVAAGLFCLDPNFLAHSALVKNDVFLSLLMCGLAYALWQLGRGGRWYWFVAAALSCGMAVNVKFSGVLFGPMLALMLLARALMPMTWHVAGNVLEKWWTRLIAVVVGCITIAMVTYIVTWAVYDFRYAATIDGAPLGTDNLVLRSTANALTVDIAKKRIPDMSPEELERRATAAAQDGDLARPVKVDLWMQKHHVLPEAWLFGFLFTYVTTLVRSAYLLGQIQLAGWWYYFPATILFKTPTATLAAMLFVPPAWLASRLWGPRLKVNVQATPQSVDGVPGWWSILAVGLAPLIYFGAALSTNLNLGLRHILPVYPFIFIMLGVGTAALIRRWTLPTFLFGGVLALALVVETVAAYPNYLAFFNAPSGGSRGGLRLLGDSNLDWGQDLPALAAWQRKNPNRKLYLCYFGTASPAAYGIDFVNLVGGWPFAPAVGQFGSEPGSLIAISATNVQGIYWPPDLVEGYVKILASDAASRIMQDDEMRISRIRQLPSGQAQAMQDAVLIRKQAFLDALRSIEPTEVLNGTIYLYNWPRK